MSSIEKARQLPQQIIETLNDAITDIDIQLATIDGNIKELQDSKPPLIKDKRAFQKQLKVFGDGLEKAAPQKRRGRPPKATLEADQRKEHQAESQAEAEPASRTV
jgi:hypothetical protein